MFKNPLVQGRRFAFYSLHMILFGWLSPRLRGRAEAIALTREAVLDTIEAASAKHMSWAVRRGKLVR